MNKKSLAVAILSISALGSASVFAKGEGAGASGLHGNAMAMGNAGGTAMSHNENAATPAVPAGGAGSTAMPAQPNNPTAQIASSNVASSAMSTNEQGATVAAAPPGGAMANAGQGDSNITDRGAMAATSDSGALSRTHISNGAVVTQTTTFADGQTGDSGARLKSHTITVSSKGASVANTHTLLNAQNAGTSGHAVINAHSVSSAGTSKSSAHAVIIGHSANGSVHLISNKRTGGQTKSTTQMGIITSTTGAASGNATAIASQETAGGSIVGVATGTNNSSSAQGAVGASATANNQVNAQLTGASISIGGSAGAATSYGANGSSVNVPINTQF